MFGARYFRDSRARIKMRRLRIVWNEVFGDPYNICIVYYIQKIHKG